MIKLDFARIFVISGVVGKDVLEHLLLAAREHAEQVVDRVVVADVEQLVDAEDDVGPDLRVEREPLEAVHDVGDEVRRDSCKVLLVFDDMLKKPKTEKNPNQKTLNRDGSYYRSK